MNMPEFDKFFSRYYSDPSPQRVAEALRCVATTPGDLKIPNVRPMMLYFFRRLAEIHSELAPQYRDVRNSVADADQEFINELLKTIDATTHWGGNALDNPIQTAIHNDLHWVEFCITGDAEPVRRIIRVLEWRDAVRAKLDQWLAAPAKAWIPGAADGRRSGLAKLKKIGISCDVDSRRVAMDADLDLFVFLEGFRKPSREQFEHSMRALPITLSPAEIDRLGTKITAAWSLASNAKQHPRVLDVCREESQTAAEPLRHLLQQIVGWAEAEEPASQGANIRPARGQVGPLTQFVLPALLFVFYYALFESLARLQSISAAAAIAANVAIVGLAALAIVVLIPILRTTVCLGNVERHAAGAMPQLFSKTQIAAGAILLLAFAWLEIWGTAHTVGHWIFSGYWLIVLLFPFGWRIAESRSLSKSAARVGPSDVGGRVIFWYLYLVGMSGPFALTAGAWLLANQDHGSGYFAITTILYLSLCRLVQIGASPNTWIHPAR